MEAISGMCTEFRYLLVRLGRQLHSHDCEGLIFVHKIPDPPSGKCDVGLHALSSLEAMGFFDPFSPENLQEILSKIGRKDLSNEVKEYKQSAVFKKAMKPKKKKGKDGGRGNAIDERRVAAKLLSGAENAVTEEERRWRDMFAMALTQTAQLVEQTELLRKTIEGHGDSEQTNRSIEEALHSILTAQDEVESLSRTLKKAVSAAGLKSRRPSEENMLDFEENDGAANNTASTDGQSKKRPLLPSPSPKMRGRERAHTYDGIGKGTATQPAASSLCTASTIAASTELSPIPILSPVPIPSPIAPSSPLTTPTTSTFTSTKVDPPSPPKPSTSPSSDTLLTHTTGLDQATKPSPPPPNRTSSIPKTKPTLSPKPFPSASSPAPSPSASPASSHSHLTRAASLHTAGLPQPHSPGPSPSNLTRAASIPTKSPAPPTKPKPSTRTPDFHRKLESLFSEGVAMATVPTSIPHSNTTPSFGTLENSRELTPSTPFDPHPTAKPTSRAGSTGTSTLDSSSTAEPTTLSSDYSNEEHIYDDPGLSREEEGNELYMNSQMVCNSAEYMNAKGLTKRDSEISIQVDSGLGSEDKSWGGELIDLKGKQRKEKPQYMNLQIREDGYAGLQGPSTTPNVQYTELNPQAK